MIRTSQDKLRVAENVNRALAAGEAVVALESTVIAHGLPAPLNIETARICEEVICKRGATPATIGIVEGVPTIGLTERELNLFAQRGDGTPIEKVGLNNLAAVIQRRGWGATTVAASLRIARAGGLRVFSTGGIGGVHRGAAESFDVSADLTALASTPIVCVCAGAKSILDLQKTVELLETLGVPIVGYRTEEFPAFYCRRSGLGVDATVNSADEAAELALSHWDAGGSGAVLLCLPIPKEFEIPARDVERATDQVIAMAIEQNISGKAVTPFLLAQMEKITAGQSLGANQALLVNNAEVAALVSVSLSRIERS
ncbi:MAG: pseudouridine-5'-phosphate glycosidase [Blastocatellia bacterium]